MRALELDFRRAPRRAHWLGYALLVAGAAGTLAVATIYGEQSEQIGRIEAGMQRTHAAARRPTAPARGAELASARETQRAQSVALELNLPWDELFASLESAAGPNVALLSVESDSVRRAIRIAGEAKDLAAMLDYLRSLGAQPTLANVHLQSHRLQQQDAQRPIRFIVGADWNA